MNRDEIKGKLDKTKGAVKQGLGRALKDRQLEQEGVDDRAKGKMKEDFGRARRKVGEAVKDVGDAIKR